MKKDKTFKVEFNSMAIYFYLISKLRSALMFIFNNRETIYLISMSLIFLLTFPWHKAKDDSEIYIFTFIGGMVIGFPLSILVNSLIYKIDFNYIIYKSNFLQKFNLYFSMSNFYTSIILNLIYFRLGYLFWFKWLPKSLTFFKVRLLKFRKK